MPSECGGALQGNADVHFFFSFGYTPVPPFRSERQVKREVCKYIYIKRYLE